MTTRDSAPVGSPCWADLWTSDVDGSRRFYDALFGWEADEPQSEFGGYFMFNRNGVPTAGGMGPMGDMPANNQWKIYLATDDIASTLKAAEADGAEIVSGEMPVGEAGIQAVLIDPTGAHVGAWQPVQFHGFSVLEEDGAPSWFELHTRDHARAVAFYGSVFGCEVVPVSDTDEFRYSILRNASGTDVAGIMDASGFLPEGLPATWSIYWHVNDPDATAAKATALGGSVLMAPETTPYGRLATLADPTGAQFKLRGAGS